MLIFLCDICLLKRSELGPEYRELLKSADDLVVGIEAKDLALN